MFYTYILKSEKDGKYYIGYTSDIEDRLKRHGEGREKSTKNRRPFTVEYVWSFETKSEAMQYEKYLKSLKSPTYILKLIAKLRGGSSTG